MVVMTRAGAESSPHPDRLRPPARLRIVGALLGAALVIAGGTAYSIFTRDDHRDRKSVV